MSPLTAEIRARNALPPGMEGIAVSSVLPGCSAAENGVEPGDIVVEAGREPVRSQQQLNARIAAVRASGRGVVLLTLNRGGELSFKALRFAQPNLEKPLRTAGR